MPEAHDLQQLKLRVADLEARVESCRAIVLEIERQGRFHLMATAQVMLQEAEKQWTTERDALAQWIEDADERSS